MGVNKINRVSVVCQNCRKEFLVIPSRAESAKFCSSDCFGESIKGVPKNAGYVSRVMAEQRMKRRCENLRENIFVCKNCNKAYIRWRRVGDEGKEYCSRECFFDKKGRDRVIREALPPVSKIRSIVHFPVCVVCGKRFTARFKNKQYCSRECSNLVCAKSVREKYRKTNGIQKKKKPCEWCGKFFLGWERSRFCSKKCLSANSHYMREPRHRARALGVYYEPVNPLKVFIRDGWRCQQCNKKLNPKNRGKMIDNAPQLDHILPWAQGGEHSYKNTQLLCRKCNLEKSSQPIGQMLMFGELEVRREHAVS